MASISYFIPNELKKIDAFTEKEKESRLNFDAKPSNQSEPEMMTICIEHKEAPQPIVAMEEEEEEDDDDDKEFFFTYEEEQEWYEDERRQLALDYAVECDLLDGVLTPPDLLPQPGSPLPVVDTGFITKDGYINHYLIASRAVHELPTLALDEHGLFWTNDGTILNQLHYEQTFPRLNPIQAPTSSSSWTHASRASAVVSMEHTKLVEKLTTGHRWTRLFPSIVSRVKGLRFLLQGSSSRNPDGSLQLIYTELQAPTPYVPKRAFTLLRSCKKIDHLTWVVADVSIDQSRNIGYPCGCLIQRIADGFSQVTWVEHLEFEESYMDNKLYTELSCRGFAFGAERWVACLERSCERIFYRTKTDMVVPCIEGQGDPWQCEKKWVMKLSQRMVRDFCSNIGPSDIEGDPAPRISCVPALRNTQICFTLSQSPYHDDPKEMVLMSSTTFSLPHSPEVIMEILGDEHRRHEWDVSWKINPLKKPTCYTTGIDSRNKISVYQTYGWFGDQVVLQEASVNRSGSLLVWSVLESKESDLVKIGKGLLTLPLGRGLPHLPVIELSGLAISFNTHPNTTSSSGDTGGGSIVTLAVQHAAYDIKELEQQTIDFAKKHIIKVADRVEAVLNESATRTSPEEVRDSCRLLQGNRGFIQYSRNCLN